jgi:DNA-binding CsgD family transcriptional regulator
MPVEARVRDRGLLGRRRERQVLDGLVADAASGTSQVLVIRGDPGVGKSSLLTYLSGRLAGWRVVSIAGVESEMELAYSGLHQLCHPLLGHLDALPAPQGDALATVFGLAPGPTPDRFLVGLATLSLLAEGAEAAPLACIVDDAQWLDRTSAQVLAFVARRLLAERVALVCAARPGIGDEVLAGMPTLALGGLNEAEARRLLLRNLHAPLDAAVLARIIAECHGNPLALLELPRTWNAADLAGGFALPRYDLIAGRIEQSYLQRLESLPADTRLLALTAAAEPLGDPVLLRRAAENLGIDLAAAEPALDAGLLRLGGRVAFVHPLVRSATYRTADADTRRLVHRALAEATDVASDPDRHAWHRACAARSADEDVAAELERSADRAQGRGGLAAAAAFLARASDLTPAPDVRARRALDAAFANLRAGAFDTARNLLALAQETRVDELHMARADLARAQLAFVSRQGREAARLLLSAARRLEPLEPELALETYLDALSAAQFAARLNDAVVVPELRQAAREAARRRPGPPTTGDLLLLAFAALTEDYPTAVPVGRKALESLRADGSSPRTRFRLLWQGSVLALELWDADSANLLSQRHLQLVRTSGALSELPLALSSWIPVLVFLGELPAAAALVEEARSLQEAAGINEAAYGALTYAAWRGQERVTRELMKTKLHEARRRGEGIGVAVSEYAHAVLCNGLGRHDEAFAAAVAATADPRELVVHNWGLSELVEAAVRIGRNDVASDAAGRLGRKARAAGTSWSLGMGARARALVSAGDRAEMAFGEAVRHLREVNVRAELARTHLLYGEWLRHAGRRLDARAELGTAHDMFAEMGLDAFTARTRSELVAAGATVREPSREAQDELTSQEAHIARLARSGLSNPEIGAQLLLSARTVEWHLRKVFAKLGISSRRELRDVLRDHGQGEGSA